MNLLQYYESWFNDFASKHIDSIEDKYKIHLKLKVEHTYRVTESNKRIAKACRLDDEGIFIASVIGLFHDVGRFAQFSKYKTFADDLSLNHGEESVRLLKEENILRDIQEGKRELIYKCIANHNSKDIPKEYFNDYEMMLYTRMVRDADRIDIYNGMANIIPNLTNEEMKVTYRNRSEENYISDDIYNKILNNIKVGTIEAKTIVEAQIVRMSWSLTDVYFKEALRIIMDNKYFEKIYGYVQKSQRLEILYNHIIRSIELELTRRDGRYYDE